MPEYQLYCFAQSGNAYRAALMLNLIGADWKPIWVDFFAKGEQRSPEYRANVNEMGEAPVLVHGDKKLSQSGVILTYLSERTGKFAPQGEDEFTLTLVRAMISAAKADGHVDDAEREKIAGKLKLAGVGSDAEKFLLAELESPLDLDTLVAGAKTDEQRLELYTASRLTIDPDTRAERGYLDLLAGRLGLPDALVDHVEATVSAAKVPVPAGTAPNPRW